tara:strand:+ start:19986 stop:21401 length:1416 start_codon:yes stop_codon:yes gene_type:complete
MPAISICIMAVLFLVNPWVSTALAKAPATQDAVFKVGEYGVAESKYRPLKRQDMVLAGATILDGSGKKITGDILVREGKIIAVGSFDIPEGLLIVDAKGKWITPGLIDVHTHYGTYLLPQTPADWEVSDVLENSSPNVADTWIEHAVRPSDPAFRYALAGGVTALQILPGSGALFGGRTVVVKPVPAVTLAEMRFPGAPQGLKMACGSNPSNSFGGKGQYPNSRQGQIAGVRKAFLQAQAYSKKRLKVDGNNTALADAPGDWDLISETLAATMNGELPVHLHCYRAEDIATWIEVLAEFNVKIAAVHHASEAYKISALLAEKRVCAAVWPDWWGFKREAEDAIPENAAFIDAAGGCAIMHSDIPLLGGLLNLEAAKAAAAGRRAGLPIPPEQAIRWITSNAAKALGLEDQIGTIASNMNADIVIWSGDPFSVYSKAETVYIDGAAIFDSSHSEEKRLSDFELGRPAKEPVP